METNKIQLSLLSYKDANDLLPILEDTETQRFLPYLCELLDEKNGIQILINTFEKYKSEKTGFLWGIQLQQKLIGFLAIMEIPSCPTIFYAMHPNYRRHGYMKICIEKAIQSLSEQKECSFIQTYIYPNNTASQDLLIKLGFTRVGIDWEEKMDIYRKEL